MPIQAYGPWQGTYTMYMCHRCLRQHTVSAVGPSHPAAIGHKNFLTRRALDGHKILIIITISSFYNVDLLHSIFSNCCMLWCQEQGPMKAVGRHRLSWLTDFLPGEGRKTGGSWNHWGFRSRTMDSWQTISFWIERGLPTNTGGCHWMLVGSWRVLINLFAWVLINHLNDIFKTLHRNSIYYSMLRKCLRKALRESWNPIWITQSYMIHAILYDSRKTTWIKLLP